HPRLEAAFRQHCVFVADGRLWWRRIGWQCCAARERAIARANHITCTVAGADRIARARANDFTRTIAWANRVTCAITRSNRTARALARAHGLACAFTRTNAWPNSITRPHAYGTTRRRQRTQNRRLRCVSHHLDLQHPH
ncbi:MAG: hypothetical protein RL341_1993, partial [Pseudomonadota bacterium]